MNVIFLVSSQGLALLLGASLVAWLVPRERGAMASVLGYGYVLGLVMITLLLRALSALGIAWTFAFPAGIALVASIALVATNRRWWQARPTLVPGDMRGQGLVVAVLLALLLVHLGLVGYEALVRPVTPFDATAQWASKARAWYEMRRMVPFVDDATWVSATGAAFTDAHPNYPGTVPLFQTWAALAWGSWNDAIADISWPLTLAALALASYGQLRRLGLPGTWALAAAYAVASLPFVDVHAALAGYADLAVAAVYALALLALAMCLRNRRSGEAALAVLCALVLPLLKAPGSLWLATLLVAPAYVILPQKWFRALAIAALTVAAAALLYGMSYGPLVILGYPVRLQYAPVARSLVDNFFVFANWNLLALLVPLIVLAARRRLWAEPFGALTAVMIAGSLFLVVVFFFSSASDEGVEAYTTVNRAVLHWIPALVAYCALLLYDLSGRSAAEDSNTTSTASHPSDANQAAHSQIPAEAP